MILDLGCGNAKVSGAIGLDNAVLPGVDVVHDLLDLPYPFEDSSADEIYLNHVLEHFALAESQRLLSEVYRILKPGGVAHIRVPHAFSVSAWADPTHKVAFTFITGDFFDRRSAKAYYRETAAIWELVRTSARVTWFNWKRFRLRLIDGWLSERMSQVINQFLKMTNWPGGADLFVKTIPTFLVEIQWDFCKPRSF